MLLSMAAGALAAQSRGKAYLGTSFQSTILGQILGSFGERGEKIAMLRP